MTVTVASLQAILDLDKKNFDDGINSANKSISKFVSGAALGGVVAVSAAASAALIKLGSDAFSMQADLDRATAKMATSLGITADEAESFEDVMLSIFEQNFGEGMEDIGDAVATVEKNLKRIDDSELEAVTIQALQLRDAFDQDLNETVRAADQLMVNMGLSGSEAMDLITAGFQSGTDAQGDLLDTLVEYSDDFGRLGLTADETLGILNRGLEAGIINTDKIGDAVNEFGINLRDPAILEGIAEIDDGLADIVSQFQAGLIDERTAFEGILSGLRDVDDQIAQDQAGVMLFRSLWEDLGADAVLALGDIEAGAQSVGGATDLLNEQYKTLGDVFESFGRRALVAIQPITDAVQDQITTLTPEIEEFGNTAFSAVDPFVDRITTLVEETDVLQNVFDNLNTEFELLAPLIELALIPLDILLGILELADSLFERVDDTLHEMGFEFETANFLFEEMLGLVTNILLPFTNLVDAIREITNLLPSFTAGWEALEDVWNGLEIPDYLQPGSPTPLETGLKGIGEAIRGLPDLSGLAGAGGNSSSINVNIGGVSATTNTAGDPNNEAIRLTLQLLRSQLEAAG